MANKKITMLQIRKILQLLNNGYSERRISRELDISRNTVKEYVQKFRQTEKNTGELLLLSDESLSEYVYRKEPIKNDERYTDLYNRFKGYTEDLQNTGVTRQLLWEEYKKEIENGYSYSQFCEHFLSYMLTQNAVMHFEHKPGAVMQVDFAGDKLGYVDTSTGLIMECPVLVCVLPFSHYMYVEALATARQEHLFTCLNRAVEYLRGVPLCVKSDNMKQYVQKSNRYEPGFTEFAQQWSIHYNTNLLATRVKKPRDKASVEKGVDLTYKRIFAPLRHEVFYSLEELNKRIFQLLEEHNRKQMQKRNHSRYDRFISEEQPLLKPLPESPFIIKHVAHGKVQKNYHVTLGEDWHHYSVPFQYIGKHTRLVYDLDEVEIYMDMKRIAIHKRNYRKHGYTTVDEHMPTKHQYYKEMRGWNSDYFLTKSTEIGENTGLVIKKVLDSRAFTEQTYNSCLGILRLGNHYGNDRLETACKRVLQTGKTNYGAVKNILDKNLDKQPCIEFYDVLTIPEHDNLRGSEAYS